MNTASSVISGVVPASRVIVRSRLVSLDAFRGMTMAAMVIVNNPGTWNAIYPPLRHAEWLGCTPTDLIFPFFLFIVGASMAFSLPAKAAAADLADAHFTRPVPWRKVFRRSAILFGLGLLLACLPWPGFEHLRIPGVLQRIALCYLLAVPVLTFLSWRWQVALAAGLLAGYWALLCFPPAHLAVPAASNPSSETYWPSAGTNWPRVIDRAVLGASHLYSRAETDPENLVGTIPALVTLLMGAWTGGAIRRAVAPWVLLAAGLLVAAVGWGLTGFMPLSKPLWTPTYVLFSGGLAAVTLASWLVLADRWRVTLVSAPFAMLGQNAILLFVGSGLLARALNVAAFSPQSPNGSAESAVSLKAVLYEFISARVSPAELSSLVFALCTLAVWTGILFVLHRLRLHLKV